jgi:hypothetical protein
MSRPACYTSHILKAVRKERRFMAMLLTLTESDARTLRDFLRDHLQGLKFEVARTEVKSFRHTLLERQELIERLLALLDREVQDLPERTIRQAVGKNI